MDCIGVVGKKYALSLNCQKIEKMNINTTESIICDGNGQPIKSKLNMKYLGTYLAADGSIGSEVAPKIGMDSQDFKSLLAIWNHCNISHRFKFQIFNSCIVQKMLYALESAWLNTSLLRKLEGFYCKCLRRILKITPSYYSRVSNQYIL